MPPQHEGWDRVSAAQCEHFAAGAASRRASIPSVDRDERLPQLQPIKGRESAGTSTAAIHTMTLAVMLLNSRTANPRCPKMRGYQDGPNFRARTANPIDLTSL